MTRTVAWLVTRLGVVLVPAWIVAAVAAGHYLPTIQQGNGTAYGGLVPSGAPALAAQRHEAQIFGNTLLTPVVIVQRAPQGLTGAQLRAAADRARAVDRRHAGVLRAVFPLPSRDRTTIVSFLYFPPDISPAHQLRVAASYARSLDPPGLRTGPLLARQSEFDQITHSLVWVTLATVALIVLVLLLTFRAVAPPLLVLGTAGIAFTIALHLLGWLAHERHQDVPKEVEPILVALLLGLVTDYSLFFLSGVRRRLAEGEGRWAAAQGSTSDNLPIIVTAGLIVTLGSLSLVAGHLEVFRSFGPGMALSVLVALVVATTFVPAILALLGPLAFWPSLGRVDRAPRERLWRVLTARPVSGLVALLVVAGLLVLGAGLLRLHLGLTLVRGQPAGAEVKRAQAEAERSFSAGITAPTEVLVPGGGVQAARIARRDPDVSLVTPVQRVQGGTAARFLVVFRQEALDAKAIAALHRLERRLPSDAQYAGDTALAADTVHAIRNDGLRVGVVVLLVNLVLLGLFLRAIAAPLYLLAASVLALAAALGATTWIMERLLRHDDVTYYVPFAASVLLLSLGSDYNVFVVGRIWQAARKQPLRDAIAETAPRTSSTITTAGITLAGSFALLALVPLRPMRELALAMAAGILLDTFVVRSLLVPSLLALFARRSADGERALHE